MMAPAWVVMTALTGCHTQREQRLVERVGALRQEVATLQAEADALKEVLALQPPPTQSVRVDNDPPGFDLRRPLPAGHPRRPDVILLSIDTLRADHLGAYGYERDTSPFLDELAAEGTVFEAAWSPSPWTLPSHATMLSGALPAQHGAIEDHLRVPDDVPLVQSTFRRAGYGTFGAVATLFVSSRYGFERGFSTFQDFGILDREQNNLSTVDADHVFHHALHWAQEQPSRRPLFLFLHVYDVHYNYDAPPPFNERFDRAPQWGDELYRNYTAYRRQMISATQLEHQVAQYDEEIAFVDDRFRAFVETWRAAGRQATIVVTSDHGEEFGERGSWGHAHTLWPEQLRVPLIVHGSGVRAQRVAQRVGTEDIAPTLAGLASLSFRAPQGVDRTPTLREGLEVRPEASAARFAETSRFDSLVLRWHRWPFDLHVDMVRKSRSLCQLEVDPTCSSNVYKRHLSDAEDLFAEMMGHVGSPWRAEASGSVQVVDGIAFVETSRHNQQLELEAGEAFTVIPGDAEVSFGQEGGSSQGPWRPFGGIVPGAGCPLSYDGRFTVGNALVVSDEDKEMLEALGYLQADPTDVPEPGPTGRRACR
ncbi:MAG: sulfatase [Myxococcales bacterium]|nr:sulfatase [Myxococcales bacterium]